MSRYSLVHLTDAASSPPELIRLAAKTGFDCVGLRGIPTRTAIPVTSVSEKRTGRSPFALADHPELLRETKLAAEQEGIVINDIENARIFNNVDVKEYERDLDAAAQLGVHEILTNIWTPDTSFAEEAFCKLCEIAAQYSIHVNLEIVTWSAIPGIREALHLLNRTRCSNQGIVLDTIHFYRSGNTIQDLADVPKEWFRYVHLCDAPAEIPVGEELVRTGLEERLIPGEGAIDIKGILQALPPVVRGLEVPHLIRIKEMGLENYLKDALQKTKQYLEGATE